MRVDVNKPRKKVRKGSLLRDTGGWAKVRKRTVRPGTEQASGLGVKEDDLPWSADFGGLPPAILLAP